MDKNQKKYLQKYNKKQSFALNAFSSVDKVFRSSAFYKFFRSYYKAEEKFFNGFFGCLFNFGKISGKIKIFKNFFAKSCENSFAISTLKSLYEKLLTCSIRSYAVVMLYFGVYAFSISAIKCSISSGSLLASDNAFYSILLILLSLIFIPIKDSMTVFLFQSKILSSIFDNYLFTPNAHRLKDKETYYPPNGTLIVCGTLLGIMTYFVTVKAILLIAAIVFFVLFLFKTPENAIPALIILCPFCSASVLFLICMLSFGAYMFKVMRGKRNLVFNYFDTLMLFAAIIIFLGGFGIYPGGFADEAVIAVASIAVYFLIRNCLQNEHGIRKCGYALSLCAAMSALKMIFEEIYLRGFFNNTNIFGYECSFSFSGHIFEDKTTFGEFILVLLPFAVMSFIISKKYSEKVFHLFSIALCTAALVMTGSKGLLLAFSMCILVYITASFHNQIASLLTVFIVGVILSLFITNSAFLGNDRFFNVNDYKESILAVTSEIASDNLSAGIGLGKENFSNIFRIYTGYSDSNVSGCYNLYLQLLAQMGIFGLIYFLCMSVCYFKMQFSCLSENRFRDFFISINGITAISSVMTVFFRGLTSSVFDDYRAFFIFIVIIAISSAAYYSAKNTRIYYIEE